MNDFFLLNNESLPHVFVGQNIEIKQIQVKNLNRFAQFAEPIKKLESYSVETITPLIVSNMIQIMGVLSLTTTIDADYFTKQLGNTSDIADLILKITQVNEAFFKKEKQQSRSRSEVNESTWFDSIQYLISCGHRPDDILNMSYGAFVGYLKAVQRLELQRLRLSAIATRAASAKSNDFDKFVSRLEG